MYEQFSFRLAPLIAEVGVRSILTRSAKLMHAGFAFLTEEVHRSVPGVPTQIWQVLEAKPALYLSILGEPPVKMHRYQQTFTFFGPAEINNSIRFLYLAQDVMDGGLKGVLDKIVHGIETTAPGMLFVDTFRAVVRTTSAGKASELELQDFVQRLALYLTAWEATTFLVGELQDNEKEANLKR